MATGGSETDKLSDETFDLLCTMCKQEGRKREADKYCTDCSDYYCTICVKVHDTVPVLKGHKIVDKGQFPPGSSKTLPMVPTERCDNHGLKPVDMYCQNDDEVGCATCMAVEHRSCKDIYYIPEFIQKNKYVSHSRDMTTKLESIEKVLTENIRNFEKEKQNALKRKAESVADIQKFRKEINSKLDAMEKKSINEVEEKFNAMISKMDEEIKALQVKKASVKSTRGNLETAGNNVSQVFVGIKLGQAVQKANNDEIKTGKQNEDITFKANQKLVEMLEALQSLGEVTQSYHRQNDTLLQIKEMKKYSVKVQSDTMDCHIFSSLYLEDGTVIIADYSNKKLKRLNRSTYSVRDHYDLPGEPLQVCAINKQEVAVSYRQPEIMFISLGQNMKQKCSIKTDFDCYGLAYASGNLYISDRETSVYIYSVSGRKLKQFNKDQSGQALFTSGFSICGLAVNKDGSKIYVSDWVKGVVILDNNGQLVRNFSCPESQAATDVHVAANGAVLVCGYDSNNVLQFGPDGRLIGEVLKVNKCRTVCCSPDMSKLIVGREMTNEIDVYDLV